MTTNESIPEPELKTGFARWGLLVAGGLCTLLGAIGAVLPIMPTTPFLLLATACFARSSPTFYRRLLGNRFFGPYLVQWRSERTVPPKAKLKAIALMILSFVVSIVLIQIMWVQITMGVVGLAVVLFLSRLPTPPVEDEA